MLSALLIGQRRIEKTMILSFWPCGPAMLAELVRALPFQHAGIQKKAGARDLADRMSRKQLLAALDAQTYPVVTESWFLLHKDPIAPTAAAGHQPGGFVVHIENGAANIFLPPRRSLVERLMAALVRCGDTARDDDKQKTGQLVSKIGKLRGNETIAVFWWERNLHIKNIRRDDLDARNLAALAPLSPR